MEKFKDFTAIDTFGHPSSTTISTGSTRSCSIADIYSQELKSDCCKFSIIFTRLDVLEVLLKVGINNIVAKCNTFLFNCTSTTCSSFIKLKKKNYDLLREAYCNSTLRNRSIFGPFDTKKLLNTAAAHIQQVVVACKKVLTSVV